MAENPLAGDELPRIVGPVPGPRSRELTDRLARVESRNITRITDDTPIFWTNTAGANVADADGNLYIDLTAGFGVSTAGHANPRVAAAIAAQAAAMPHALGDVHPAAIKVRLLERLAAITPGDLSVTILGSAGAEAVEAALKSALLKTGRPGILAFEGAYHGLTGGALAVTWRAHFRAPFRAQLADHVRFVPFPTALNGGTSAPESVERIDAVIAEAERGPAPIGAILVEPIQGRAGILVPPPGFLRMLRELCDGSRTVLIFDEVYTGFGRTGRWFACEHEAVVPDVMALGKALSGSVPISAAVGTPDAMAGWPPSRGEAVHTSTFLGNPVACAAALAQIDEIERNDLIARARELGDRIRARTEFWTRRYAGVTNARGAGILQAVTIGPAERAAAVATMALREGVIVLTEGPNVDALAITPPAVITGAQLDHALDVIGGCLNRTAC
ncbi:MAG: aminotransferase class III-fold pyridoxal phosphate-dependent enzyme [Gemmatimonadetes bacterium]|nr:aminotransferase class III-fold pyridoxal phosphate-dependent enzyme [Gemmatimonadota bacterium]